MNFKKLNFNDLKNFLKKFIYWVLSIIGIIIISLVISFVILFFTFGTEAKNQKEFDEYKSAGDCRILNSAFAYDKNYKFEIHSFIQKTTPTKENDFQQFKKLYHLYAVDENDRIYDVSNGNNYQNMSYEDFFKLNNYIYDELLVSGEINKNHFNLKVEWDNIIELPALASIIMLPVYYSNYKIYR